jgi:ATP-dependent Clp protease ATP-binding subunit ClpC
VPSRRGKPRAEDVGNTLLLIPYGRDLTVMARDGKIDPVIGRDKEIERHNPDPEPQDQRTTRA